MKDIIKINFKQKQWIWFVGLWAAGFVGAVLLGYITKWIVKLGYW